MKVTVLGKPMCTQCDSTISWLKIHNIEYNYEDITAPENLESLLYFKEQGLMSAPIVVVEDWMGQTFWAGHKEDQLVEHLL